MTCRYRLVFFCTFVCSLGLICTVPNSKSANASVPDCPTPALDRIQRHQVASGETLESIAQRYNLTLATIIAMNPGLRRGTVPVGSEINIAPFNGIVVEVPPGQTLRQLAAKYRVRADTLFEVNGCEKDPKVVFVPVTEFSTVSNTPIPTPTPTQVGGYPLPQAASVGLAYGWQMNPDTGEVFFHSGVDLSAPVGTSVQAIAPGIVAFAREQGTYGNLVIINHASGLQSRYAQLDTIKVSVGQQVQQGDLLGTVGTTGKPTSKQPHLHFEVRSSSSLGWVAKDPKQYLKL